LGYAKLLLLPKLPLGNDRDDLLLNRRNINIVILIPFQLREFGLGPLLYLEIELRPMIRILYSTGVLSGRTLIILRIHNMYQFFPSALHALLQHRLELSHEALACLI
jgi:hypothetical protein